MNKVILLLLLLLLLFFWLKFSLLSKTVPRYLYSVTLSTFTPSIKISGMREKKKKKIYCLQARPCVYHPESLQAGAVKQIYLIIMLPHGQPLSVFRDFPPFPEGDAVIQGGNYG